MTATELAPKSPNETKVETRHIVLPNHANHYGTAFGGVLMSWIDIIAAMVAQRHSGKDAVTASVDRLNFIAPIQVGDHVILKAMVNHVGRSSMEVGVQVTKEDPYTGIQVRATTAYLSFVALDENKKPIPVPGLILETEDHVRRFKESEMRVQANKEFVAKLRESRKKN